MAPVLLFLALLSSCLRLLDGLVLSLRPRLLLAYLGLQRAQWRKTPYAARTFADRHDARAHHKSQAEITYGETPIVTAMYLLWRAGCNRKSSVLDLGAGRGRVLLAARYLRASCRGVELLASHVAQVQSILASIGGVLEHGDAANADMREATHIFLAWTCFSERTRQELSQRLLLLPDGARVIALNWGVEHPGFRAVTRGQVLCSWGVTPYFILERARKSECDGG
jgi:SAM-dependent methyltransferase